jgi:two-component system catabolic regulation response regulator CreB
MGFTISVKGGLTRKAEGIPDIKKWSCGCGPQPPGCTRWNRGRVRVLLSSLARTLPGRILIIEDEPAIADNIVYALETEGFRCRWCATGREGLAALADTFDLAVLDVGLPDIGGFDLCREIRKRHDLPILFLTARAGEIDRVVGLELGADDYVVKPFSPRELAARIKAILRRTVKQNDEAKPGEAKPGGPAISGDGPDAGGQAGALPFQHDTERCAITYFGTRLDLSRYEYRLLLALIGKPGRVWSRERLMEKAWDEPDASLDRTVDAHIKALRAKLRQVKPEVEAILTHRGLGYSLKEDW